MWSSVILLLLLLAQPGDLSGYCAQLQDYYTNTTDECEVRVNGQAVEIVVRGSGGAARAAAALLLVAIHLRGYQARLNTTSVHICDLISIYDLQEGAVVAPAVKWPKEGCKKRATVDFFSILSRPAAPFYELLLWAYVPSDDCLSKIFMWTFFRNYTEVEKCGFITSNSIDSIESIYNYFAVLARNESSNDIEVSTDLQKRFDSSNLPLQIKYYQNDYTMRKQISKLINQGKSFLFLDENLWFDAQHVVNVQPPCPKGSTCTSSLNSMSTFRVGNGGFMTMYAPQISKLVGDFSPKASQLREILDIEARQNDSHIEEAACSWVLNHTQEFQDMISYNITHEYNTRKRKSVFDIRVILCDGDPLNKIFEKVIVSINKKIFNPKLKYVSYDMYASEIDCFDKERLKEAVTNNAEKAKTAGLVAWSFIQGIISAAEVAKQFQLPLVLAGPVAPEVRLGHSVWAATGNIADLTRALYYLLDSCGWSRVAILSDNSEFSKSFVETLMKQEKLLIREMVVNDKNIDSHLHELEKADARIFFLNVNWNISCQILSAALKEGMTPTNGFVWITRDWRPLGCSNNITWDGMYHYSINFGWRGENVENGSIFLQNELRNLSNINETSRELLVNADLSTLADALLQLGYRFEKLHQQYPSYKRDIRENGTTSKFLHIFENVTINGVAQELKIKDFALKNALVFINKWYGLKSESVAVLRINQNNISIESSIVATCKTLYGSQLVRDRPYCGTLKTGDPFSPRCQDLTVIVVAMLLILLVTALYIARRNRLKRLLDRELNIMASLLEIRNRTASSLDMYLVNRNSIKLLHEIGSGSFGRVHFAELQRPGQGTVVVAAKEPRKDIGPNEECEFFHEACVLAPLCHDNIIKLIGICITNGPPTVLMEHAYYLDLKRYLTERKYLISGQSNDTTSDRAIEVSDESLTRLAREAAGALMYLTGRRLVHRDVRAANCLIDKNRSLKLGDFGMARELDDKAPEYATIRRALFPVLWMAPESLQLGVFSFATDIWSLGVLIMEVVTLGARPYGDWLPSRVLNYVAAGGFPPLPPDVSKQTSSLLHSCWERKAESRPSASWVHRYLTQNPRALSPALLKPYPPDPPIVQFECRQ